MSFKDIVFPDIIAKNSLGGPEFSTNLVETKSCKEFRSQNWQYPRLKYNVSSGIQSGDDVDKILTFFRICKGRMHSFRFTDFSDRFVDNQVLGLGDGIKRNFQLIKTYTQGNFVATRKITKPTNCEIFLNGVKQVDGSFSVDKNSGDITFTQAPPSGAMVSASYGFDVEMRFDIDYLPISRLTHASYKIAEIPLIEIIL